MNPIHVALLRIKGHVRIPRQYLAKNEDENFACSQRDEKQGNGSLNFAFV